MGSDRDIRELKSYQTRLIHNRQSVIAKKKINNKNLR